MSDIKEEQLLVKPLIYEVVSGEILLSSRREFFRLHDEILLPIMQEIGIKPLLLLITEIGRYGKFVDIYCYENYDDYFKRTERLLARPEIEPYYEQIGKLINGTIDVELMREMPYMTKWK
jgi:hypothetical protein